ncbi:ABC transporter substrate-binding protein [Comamonas composti]|uniref:ABC transporter substrate-binding protein n=1 Tax=Comamonas composti TaxID=408558 RepID=UPI0004241B40|nr:ABC transporter substrate-binding protein [Comamonas composti]
MKPLTFIAAAALTVVAATGAHARSLQAIQKDGTIRLATEGYYTPFAYFEGKNLTGFEVDLAQLIAQKLGLKFEWKTISFDALLTGLKQDRWDLVISSHAITPEREKAVSFTQPHYCSGAQVIALTNAIQGAKDLEGKTVAAQTGTTYLDYVQKNVHGVKRLVNFPTNEAALNALMTKRVDAWVTERFLAKEMLRKNPKIRFHQGDMLYVERIAAAVTKDNQPLADAWNKALQELLRDGSYAKLSQKWFQEDIRCPD